MKKLLTILLFTALSFAANAQCEEYISGQNIQKGMFVYGNTTENGTLYVAEVTSATGTDFSCRFLHSNSKYEFTALKRKSAASVSMMQATVKSSKGGGYAAGTVFSMNIFMRDPDACDLSAATRDNPYNVIVTFVADNKSYLARLQKISNGYYMQFQHSKSLYTVDDNFKVISVKGGGYAVGSQMKVVHARLLKFENMPAS